MFCEGDKTYDKPGDCPVCGMDLVEKAVSASSSSENKTYLKLLKKFKIALIFTFPIFIISMSGMIPNNPLYKLMPIKNWGWVEFIFSIPVVFYATWMFFERAWRSILSRNFNMFTLIGIGAGVSWIFSVIALFFPNFFPEQFKNPDGSVHLYFEAATVILTLVLLGQLLEARAHGKTNEAIRSLLELAPNTAFRVVNGVEETIDLEDVQIGDILRVKPGGKIPVDGMIIEGESHIDESMITGEPLPASKGVDSEVKTGTINGNKSFLMKAQKIGEDTLLSQIVRMVNDAAASKAPVQKLADKISGYFVPIVVLIAALTFIIWSIWGPEPPLVYALINSIAVLIIACPCALGLATPMSIKVGMGKGAHSGVLIKNAEALEKMNKTNIVVVDKTGTVTEGKPTVNQVVCTQEEDCSNFEILKRIVALNTHSEHPLAYAILKYGEEKQIQVEPAQDFESVIGKGVIGVLNGKKIALGNRQLMAELQIPVPAEVSVQVSDEQKKGNTVSMLAEEGEILGFVSIGDKIKAGAREAIKQLQDEGVDVWLFTGDNEETAKAVVDVLGIDGFKAGMLPGDKLKEIRALQAQGKIVAMAGDGINDAPALTQADVGIAMGTGTDIAIESADVTLVKGDLKGIARARTLSAKTMKNIRENLFFALGYNALGIPIAAGLLYPFFGLLLSPMIAALAMSFSSVSVIANALRLRSAKI